MSILILLAAALLPAVLLWIYIVRQDPQPEPTGQLAKAVMYGVAICIPVALLEMVIQHVLFGEEPTTLFGTTIDAFFAFIRAGLWEDAGAYLNINDDLNLDGKVDVSDAVLLARFVAEDSGANVKEQGKANADVNSDKQLDGDDVIGILRIIAKLDE